MMKRIAFLIITVLLILVSCYEGIFNTKPILDNRWDPDNSEHIELPEIPADGLLAEYLFEGSTADSSGNGNDCTGNPGTYGPDRFGAVAMALNFDGDENYLDISNTDLAKFDINEYQSISFWVKTTSGGTLFGHSYYGAGDGWRLVLDTSNLNIGSNYDNQELRYTYLTNSDWHHVYLYNNGFNLMFYIDGDARAEMFSCDYLDYSDSNSLYFMVGIRFNDSSLNYYDCFSGMMDDIRIYNRTLTENEVLALYYEGY
ncbi:MAG: LamG domain-containing protein [Spirochaetales bacterium]|nr:LamG domain-containing protein [Spirochaetales bacterium]